MIYVFACFVLIEILIDARADRQYDKEIMRIVSILIMVIEIDIIIIIMVILIREEEIQERIRDNVSLFCFYSFVVVCAHGGKCRAAKLPPPTAHFDSLAPAAGCSGCSDCSPQWQYHQHAAAIKSHLFIITNRYFTFINIYKLFRTTNQQ